MMGTVDSLLFNVAAFASGLFLLEYGADKFIDHTAVVAKRLRVSPTLIGLLTCGAEWEELVVIITCLSQDQSALALGNLMGSAIANILASFALGLLISRPLTFDRSSKIYTALLMVLTSVFLLLLCLLNGFLQWLGGIMLIGAFSVYVASVATLIYRGTMTAPESDSDDSDGDSSDDTSDSDGENEKYRRRASSIANGSGLVARSGPKAPKKRPYRPRKQPRSLRYHVLQLLLGMVALLLSSYVIAHSAATIGSEISLSSTVVGTTVLSFATTLPEKFVAVVGGLKRQPGIMIANTVGSNIFLMTLCGGVLFLGGDLKQIQEGFTAFEALVVWGSAALISTIVVTGANRWVGFGSICLYIAFVVTELSTGRKLDDG